MALDSTARETNFRDSIKRYLVDNLSTVENIPLSFDKTLATPKVQGQPSERVQKWVVLDWGTLHRGAFSEATFDIYCCSRRDYEGFKLAQLVDKVMGYLRDSTTTDCMRRVPFYKSAANLQDWELLGGIIITDVIESAEMEGPDETKFKILSVMANFASKL